MHSVDVVFKGDLVAHFYSVTPPRVGETIEVEANPGSPTKRRFTVRRREWTCNSAFTVRVRLHVEEQS